MRIIGLIGGMSWESSLEYYRIINEEVKRRLGGLHSARILMMSVDFHEIEEQQRAGDWRAAAKGLAGAAQGLERGGADFFLICTNTMHKVAPEVRAAVGIPLVHIADAVALEIAGQGLKRVGLLGTRFTMEEDFLKGYLRTEHGLEVLVPEADERRMVHDVIYNELCLGIIDADSRRASIEIIESLGRKGAQGVILGCTELPLLIQAKDVSLPLFDTTALHAKRAVDLSLEQGDVVECPDFRIS